MLFALCQPPEKWAPLEGYTYDRIRLEQLDQPRHEITPVPQKFGEDITYMQMVSDHVLEALRRFSKSFTVDRSILDYLQRTRSSGSRSERVNELLRRAIREEQYEALEREAGEFFAAAGRTERAESRAFARASRRSLTRAGE